ncbi:uncharacterized protein BDZ83DRAFT_262669 [Colletotrichum acutatum]|uniref:Secreted protein n=1 Tax=Glomerella acutata TaxID=27357 RepID=A0AAD8UMZ3_GLOAC|nr:uncharacterized protein BDZ83DRAFT_262669 [Colletotrichum acutatum]KAK1726333.1 hypothetical protein BDZ83DRAFT_262669 [Colletotrichum acutatum]
MLHQRHAFFLCRWLAARFAILPGHHYTHTRTHARTHAPRKSHESFGTSFVPSNLCPAGWQQTAPNKRSQLVIPKADTKVDRKGQERKEGSSWPCLTLVCFGLDFVFFSPLGWGGRARATLRQTVNDPDIADGRQVWRLSQGCRAESNTSHSSRLSSHPKFLTDVGNHRRSIGSIPQTLGCFALLRSISACPPRPLGVIGQRPCMEEMRL